MQPPHQHSRINLAELKAQIVRKLGLEGSKQYFYYLNRFLGLKLSKVELNKLCLRLLGHENIPLHNEFIRSILKNAYSAKVPPQVSHEDEVLKHSTLVSNKEIPNDGHQQDGSHAAISQATGLPGLSNGGDMLSVLPRKARTMFLDRRTGERHSALGPNGKTSFASQQLPATQSSDFNVIYENGHLDTSDIGKVVHHQGPKQHEENERVVSGPHPANLSEVNRSSDDPDSVHSMDQTELLVRHNTKEVSARSPLRAPLGIPLCPVSIGGAQRSLPLTNSSRCTSTFDDGALLDSLKLRERMEHVASAQGLEGVSVECANILNLGLDSYVKHLIRSCIQLVGVRSGNKLTMNNRQKHQAYMKLVNGVRPGHQYQMQGSGRPLEVQEHRTHCPISLQDFRIAMELNPQQLGENWPLLLEKICTHSFEE
ncbi:uncharacterized protein LOC111405189 [Olea europaea var. sylvestris]|uniref:Uncharacterized protein LOC111405189 n=1 Tax=Olea europaea subsp. europaea TaxID=158383 RepID=A0A8S0PMA1_OLEEU|nr:uncharacterized protein LOC111405189 [Olea europaea var. sylvestris]CAA2946582.1 uncharacterized protein LOC111405189 [Olea europaea subsp. europaea]